MHVTRKTDLYTCSSYIYTSGTWVYGDDRKNVVTDTTPITKPATLVAWRPAVEQEVLNSKVWNGIVARPGLLYGRGGSLVGPLFQSALNGKVQWPGTAGARINVIHCDDLANFYLLAAEKAHLIGGKVFAVVTETSESAEDLLARLAHISGAKSWELTPPSNCK